MPVYIHVVAVYQMPLVWWDWRMHLVLRVLELNWWMWLYVALGLFQSRVLVPL